MIAAHPSPTLQDRSQHNCAAPGPLPLVVSEFLQSASDRHPPLSNAVVDRSFTQFPKQSLRDSLLRKLAGSRENAKRFFRFGASVSTPSHTTHREGHPRPVSEIFISQGNVQMLASAPTEGVDLRSDTSSVVSVAPSQPDPEPVNIHPSEWTTGPFPALSHEKVVATGTGLTVGIALTEPVLYLAGYDQTDPRTKKSAILRGHLHLKVSKPVKIKKISICFRGSAQTDWPEGIPPRKIHFHDRKDLVTHGVLYFNQGNTTLVQNDYGAHYYQYGKPVPSVTGKDGVTATTRELFSKSSSSASMNTSAKDIKRLSLQPSHHRSRSFGRNDTMPGATLSPQRNYRIFPAGDYLYGFEFPIDGSLPETIKTELGSVRYDIEALVERSGAFRPNLLGALEVPVIRTPAEGSLEQIEPIAISRNWEDQLHYDIVISGKSFPLGSQVPIAFKLTPLAKVECHRIKVYVTENAQHWTADKSVHRFQPAKKVLLFEKRADSQSVSTYAGSSMRITSGGGIPFDQRAAAANGEEIVDRNRSNLLGDLSSDMGIGSTEMEFNVQLPSCHAMKGRDESQRLHFDTTYENIQITHWIKIVLRLSKVDERDPGKRRHFEISIDSPFHLLSCKATHGNIYLPAYTSLNSDPVPPAEEFECGCPGAPVVRRGSSVVQIISSGGKNSSPRLGTKFIEPGMPRSFTSGSIGLTPPPQAHLAHDDPDIRASRPIHLLRAPSFAPPAFEDVPPPPPLATPPPDYTSAVGDNNREAVLADYFQRLSFYEDRDDDGRGLGRVDVPLTPGGRVNRSMDVPRDWVRIDQSTV